MKEKKNKKNKKNKKKKIKKSEESDVENQVKKKLNIVNLELNQEKPIEKPRNKKNFIFTEAYGIPKNTGHSNKDKYGFLCSIKRFPVYENLNPGPSHYCIRESSKCFVKNKIADKIPDEVCRVLSPGPADYNVIMKKKCNFNTKSSVHFPVLYGREPDCSDITPAPNAYNISKHPSKRCCYWRRGRSMFASPLFQTCHSRTFKPAPNQYSINYFSTEPHIHSQSHVSFKSNVSQFHSFTDRGQGSGLSPCHYNPKIDVCVMKRPKSHGVNILNLRTKPLAKLQKIPTPGPGAYEVGKSGACLNVSQQPNWFFQHKVVNECEDMMEMWREMNKKKPGPAEYDVKLPKHKSFNYGYKNFISVV